MRNGQVIVTGDGYSGVNVCHVHFMCDEASRYNESPREIWALLGGTSTSETIFVVAWIVK